MANGCQRHLYGQRHTGIQRKKGCPRQGNMRPKKHIPQAEVRVPGCATTEIGPGRFPMAAPLQRPPVRSLTLGSSLPHSCKAIASFAMFKVRRITDNSRSHGYSCSWLWGHPHRDKKQGGVNDLASERTRNVNGKAAIVARRRNTHSRHKALV